MILELHTIGIYNNILPFSAGFNIVIMRVSEQIHFRLSRQAGYSCGMMLFLFVVFRFLSQENTMNLDNARATVRQLQDVLRCLIS